MHMHILGHSSPSPLPLLSRFSPDSSPTPLPLLSRFSPASLPLLTRGALPISSRSPLCAFGSYAMAVAPLGSEGSFAGIAAAISFLAELPAGLLGGFLLDLHCPRSTSCDSAGLFGSLGAFAAVTPLLLWSCPSLLREPSADVSGGSHDAFSLGELGGGGGGDGVVAGSGGIRKAGGTAAELRALQAAESEGEEEHCNREPDAPPL